MARTILLYLLKQAAGKRLGLVLHICFSAFVINMTIKFLQLTLSRILFSNSDILDDNHNQLNENVLSEL